MSEERSSGQLAWRAPSLRGRIALLASTMVGLLLVAGCLLVWVIRSSEATTVSQAQRHLRSIAGSLQSAYQQRTDRSVALLTLPAPPPPPPPRRGAPPPPPPPPPPGVADPARSLDELTARVLADEPGVEGGLFRARDARLVAYAFPTHEGPGDPRALPARETPEIVRVAQQSVAARSVSEDQFRGVHDVVLFVAAPVCETAACEAGPVGAVWLMERLHGVEADRKRLLLWGAFLFALMATVPALLAFFVLRQVGQGTQAVLEQLSGMESDLALQRRSPLVRFAEFNRLLDGLDRLGATLRVQIERERELQARVLQSERLAAIGQLAASVAHELRNPLATLRLRAQMTQRKTEDSATAQSCAIMLAQVDRLDATIERLLDFSRPLRLDRQDVDVGQLAAAAVQRWSARYPHIAIDYTGTATVSLSADPMRLEQVLDNLIENAVLQLEDAKPEGPWIRVHCLQTQAAVELTVSDNAGGFSGSALQNATEPFFTTRARGTGLGLAITQEIVHALGGELRLSNNDQGAVVRIHLSESGPN